MDEQQEQELEVQEIQEIDSFLNNINDVTTSEAVQYDFDKLHEDLVLLDSRITDTNNYLKSISLGMDFSICILVVLLVSKFLLNFFDRGFK